MRSLKQSAWVQYANSAMYTRMESVWYCIYYLSGGYNDANKLNGTIDGIRERAGEIADATSEADAQNRNIPQMVATAEREAAKEAGSVGEKASGAHVLIAKVVRALIAVSKALSVKPPAFPKPSEKTDAATTETHKSITEKVPKWM